MRHFMLIAGIGFLALAGDACGAGPVLPLAVVAARNAVAAVQQWLDDGYAADERDGGGLTALMWAARSGSVDAMQTLLAAGADPNARDGRHGWTALFHAVHTRRVDAVRLLLE